ncbi:MAG: DUF4384 domain-containing protein [Bryobacterales bacterium]|nr:DUF4384 domain-containing protein [Bryobacterales bacterium]
MNRTAFLPLRAVAAALPALSQTKALQQGPNRMELTLERKTSAGWKVVDPGFIFNQGDYVRFRFKTNFNGYLYVMNQGTAGTYTKLFPREDTGLANKVAAGKEYIVPATAGAFRIDGPAGHDIIYWMMTPVEMGGGERNTTYTPLPPPPSPTSAKAMASLTPRCDDTILRARGECVDSSAGPHAVADASQLPSNIKTMAQNNSQELIFRKDQRGSVVSSPVPLNGPVVYEFRLAHK